MLAGLLIAAAAATTLAPVAPSLTGVPPGIARALPGRWAAAFEAGACSATRRVSPGLAAEAAAAKCDAVPACVARALRGGGAALAAVVRISFADASYKVGARLVDVATGAVLQEFTAADAASAAGLDAALGAAARRLCAAVARPAAADLDLGLDLALPDVTAPPAKPAAPAVASMDLDLLAPAAPGGGLDLTLEPVAPAARPAATVPPAKPKAAPAAPPADALALADLAPLDPGPAKPVAKPVAAAAPPPTTPAGKPPAEPPAAKPPEVPAPAVAAKPPQAPPPPLQPGPEPAPAPGRGRRLGAWIAGGSAVLAAGGGALLGFGTLSAARTRDAAPDYAAFATAQSAAERNGLLTNACWGVAAATAATSALLFVLSSP